MHSLICGTTGSGKSVLAESIARQYRKMGYSVIVYDPFYNDDDDESPTVWHGANVVVNNEPDFLRIFNSSKRCVVIVDESSSTIGQHNKAMIRTATQGRHRGHSCYYVTQRVTQLSPNVRDNCGRLFLFASSGADSKIHAGEWNEPELENAHRLKVGEHYDKMRMQPCRFNKLKLRSK